MNPLDLIQENVLMRILKIIIIISLFFIISCGWKNTCLLYSETKTIIGIEKTSVVGSGMIDKRYVRLDPQCLKMYYEPTGLNLTLFKREPTTIYYEPIIYNSPIESELLYAGREGNTLHITYREYTVKGMARTPFFQNLYYDLSQSNKIVFQNWIIQVISADNQQIVFQVIAE